MAKDKSVAVILAVFFSFWAWLYTYNKDSGKFWAGLIASFLGIFMLLIPSFIVWIWAIVDRASLERKVYEKMK